MFTYFCSKFIQEIVYQISSELPKFWYYKKKHFGLFFSGHTVQQLKMISTLFDRSHVIYLQQIILVYKVFNMVNSNANGNIPMHMAVPVSWQLGSTMSAAMLAFFNNSSATNRSLLEASGSFKMFDSCCYKQNKSIPLPRTRTRAYLCQGESALDVHSASGLL